MNVDVGSLNKRIRIISTERQRDNAGCWTGQDRPVHACWASFSRKSAKELLRDNADFTEEQVRFLIRTPLTKKLTRKMLVIYAGDRYEIEYINDYGDNREFMELLCRRLTKEA